MKMDKLRMTNNEYQEYIEGLAGKLWTDENYTFKQYCEDCDNVDIIPFELDRFNLPQKFKDDINYIFTTDYIDKNGIYTLKGSSQYEEDWYKFTEMLDLKRATGYYYSGYSHNDEYGFYMEHCEGDIWLKLFENKADYEKSLNATIKWYEEN